jgi:hypothetical protein
VKKKISLLIIGMSLFILGYVATFLFNAFTLWDDLEGMSFWGYPEVTMYDHTIDGDLTIININCPLVITNLDTTSIKINVKNIQKVPVDQIIQTHISYPGEEDNMIKEPTLLSFFPGERKTVSREISQKNQLDYNHIFVRVFLIKAMGQPPYATNHCGVSVINTDRYSGMQIELGITLGYLASMITGIILWYVGSSPYMRLKNKVTNLIIAMGTLALISVLINYSGLWLLASLFLFLSLLLILSLLEHRLLG